MKTLFKTWSFVLGLLIGFLVASLCYGSDPASEVAAATVDLQANVSSDSWPTTRYVSQYNATQEEWTRNAKILSFVLNTLSRSPVIIAPPEIGPTGLMRIDLRAYGLSTRQWEALISNNEPYFHLTTEVIVPVTGQSRREWIPTGRRRGFWKTVAGKTSQRIQKVFSDGGWVGLQNAAKLRTFSGSAGAVVRLDWLISRITTPPFYYEMAGVPETKEKYYKSLGLDRGVIRKLQAERGANLFFSKVTKKVRRLARAQGPLGGVWDTYDFATNDPQTDPIRNPQLEIASDASEHIAAKPNGLFVFAVFGSDGKRVDSVPDVIAKDNSDPRGDGILRPMISCVRCHVEDGLRPFANDQKELVAQGVSLLAPTPEAAAELAAFYLSDKIDRELARDREDYAEAVSRATGGMKNSELVKGLADLFGAYGNELVTPKVALRELGVLKLERLRKSNDPVLLALLVGKKVQRTQWEAGFAEAATLVKTESK